MSIMDDLDWGLDNDDYGTKESKADPKSLGGYKRWTSASDREATTKKSKSKNF